MRTRREAVREAVKEDDDRGAVLFILLLFLVIFIAVAAVAVDLAALGARGQELQNTSDAAALAGVVEYQEVLNDTADPDVALAEAREKVEDVLRQNGIDPDSGSITIELTLSDDGSQLTVRITDDNPDEFLPSDLLGDTIKPGDAEISRQATAEFLACEATCTIEVTIPKPFESVRARGKGDGYKPILVKDDDNTPGDRLYALNHNSSDREIVCVSVQTQGNCWPEGPARNAYAGNYFDRNPEMPQTAVVGSKIYWAATDTGNGLRLFCWETVTDTPCSSSHTLDNSLLRYDEDDSDNILTDDKDENRGGGTFGFQGKVFVFSDNHRIHCFDPTINTICAGYSTGGNPTALNQFPPSSPVEGNHGSSIDRIIDETTGYVYSTLHIPFAQEGIDCTSPLADPAGRRVVIRNHGTIEERYLASNAPDNVYAADTGADERMWWDVENVGGDTVSIQSVLHGEWLDSVPFPDTSGGFSTENEWNIILPFGVGGPNESYFIDSEFNGGGLFDDDGAIVEEDPPSSPQAEWNFYPWQCGIDPDRADTPTPDYFKDGTWLHCYNTGTLIGSPGPCPGFQVAGVDVAPGTPSPIHADATRFSGRLWFYNSGGGVPTGVCSSGYSQWYDPGATFKDPSTIQVVCVSIGSGNYNDSMSIAMNPVEAAIQSVTGTDPNAWGDPHWNESQNRLYYPTQHEKLSATVTPLIICYDFDSGFCGTKTGTVPPNPSGETLTEDYGFVSDGDCVYALGHNAFFWAFSADDIEEPCDIEVPPSTIYRCPCGDGETFRWGELDFTDVPLESYDVFEIRIVTDEEFPTAIFPLDGAFLSLKPPVTETPRITLDDLMNIPADAESILVEFRVAGVNLDELEDIGNFVIRFGQRPKLVD